MMKVDFMMKAEPGRVRTVMPRPSPIPDPTRPERPAMKKNKPLAPTPITEEPIEIPPEMPDAFSKFLDQLENVEEDSPFDFEGETYDDILQGGFQIAGLGDEARRGRPGIPERILDSRVQVVVTRVPRGVGKNPPTYIEDGYTDVPYPKIEVEKRDYQKGWTSVYYVISIDSEGEVEEIRLMRPKNPNELESVFLKSVLETIRTWQFKKEKSFVHVDVRFYVE
jgi:hypothetical protein